MSGMTKKQLSKAIPSVVAIVLTLPWFFLQEEIKQMTSWGYVGLFLSCLFASATILVPAGSTMSVVIASSLLDPLLCVLIGSIGATLGEQSAFLVGKLHSQQAKYAKNKFIAKWQTWMCQRSWLKVFIAAAIPLPIYDIVAVGAGAIHMSWGRYMLATACGKIVKYAAAIACFEFVLPLVANTMGDPFRSIIETMLNALTLATVE